MATLNIKDFRDELYEKLRAHAKRERRSVAQEVTGMLVAALDPPRTLSIMDMQGLGAALRQGVDAAAHVETERASWD